MTEVTCAIIIENERILVTRRSPSMPHPLKWEFPGGKVKSGESPEYCIRREIREELGLEVDVKQLLPAARHTYGERTIKLIPFVCSIRSGKINLTEHSSFSWVNPDELDKLDWLDADLEVVSQLKKRLNVDQ
jgi:8-oxo-dGTP diphosphatase